VGGIARAIHFIFAGLVVIFSRTLFMNSILGELFLVKVPDYPTKFYVKKSLQEKQHLQITKEREEVQKNISFT
jgi:hypothetical protein